MNKNKQVPMFNIEGCAKGERTNIPPPAYVIIRLDDGRLIPIKAKEHVLGKQNNDQKMSRNKPTAQHPFHVEKHHPLTTAIAVTFHKVQGATVDRIVMVLATQANQRLPDLQAMIVGMSRVREGKHLRVLLFKIKSKLCHSTTCSFYSGLAC